MDTGQWGSLYDKQTRHHYVDFGTPDVRMDSRRYQSTPYNERKSRHINIDKIKEDINNNLENSPTLKRLSANKKALLILQIKGTITPHQETDINKYQREIISEIDKIIKETANSKELLSRELSALRGLYISKYNIHPYMIKGNNSSSGGYKQSKTVAKRPAKKPAKKPTTVRAKPVKPAKKPTTVRTKPANAVKRPVRK